jgi:hypothetical protein
MWAITTCGGYASKPSGDGMMDFTSTPRPRLKDYVSY